MKGFDLVWLGKGRKGIGGVTVCVNKVVTYVYIGRKNAKQVLHLKCVCVCVICDFM